MWTSKKISMLLFLPVFLNIFLSTPCLSSMLCHPDDRAALLQLQNYYVGNSSGKSDFWADNTDCCKDWYGVDCDPTNHRIISVRLVFGGGLTGEISPAIGDLPYLQHLDIRKHPNLTGPIPASFAKLKNLDFIRLDWNNLTGPIPSFFSQLKKLNYINLAFNKFSGSIPPSLSLLPNLQAIFLSRNQLTGPIPESFGSLKPFFFLDLSHNILSGAIPRSLERVEFQSLILARNHLTGDIRNSSTWLYSDLSRNLLEFNLSNWVIGPGFSGIDFSHNKIYGSIPPMLANVPNLQYMNVSYNRLCGPIPTGGRFDGVRQYSVYTYQHNRCLCGKPLPPCK